MKAVKEIGHTFEGEETSSNPKQSFQWDPGGSVTDLPERIGKFSRDMGTPGDDATDRNM
jgi:hypothetical protein